MKREFLQNLKVEGNPLPKDVIDAIMGENGKDIEAAKAGAPDQEALKQQLSQLEEKYAKAVEEHAAELSDLRFSHTLDKAITGAKGRNAKAITALLDLDTLRQSQDPEGDIAQALESLKEESDYLFCRETPPPYARGTGAYKGAEERSPVTLAGALRERFEKERI